LPCCVPCLRRPAGRACHQAGVGHQHSAAGKQGPRQRSEANASPSGMGVPGPDHACQAAGRRPISCDSSCFSGSTAKRHGAPQTSRLPDISAVARTASIRNGPAGKGRNPSPAAAGFQQQWRKLFSGAMAGPPETASISGSADRDQCCTSSGQCAAQMPILWVESQSTALSVGMSEASTEQQSKTAQNDDR